MEIKQGEFKEKADNRDYAVVYAIVRPELMWGLAHIRLALLLYFAVVVDFLYALTDSFFGRAAGFVGCTELFCGY